VTAAPPTKAAVLAFQLSGMRFRKRSATTVKIRKLSMPAQGHAISNVAVRRGLAGSIAVRRGMLAPAVMLVWYPIRFSAEAARVVVVGTSSWKGVNCP